MDERERVRTPACVCAHVAQLRLICVTHADALDESGLQRMRHSRQLINHDVSEVGL